MRNRVYFNDTDFNECVIEQSEMLLMQAKPILESLTSCRLRRQSLPRFINTEEEAKEQHELNALEIYLISQLHALLGYDDVNKKFIF
jgi:hypothetical protein